MKKTLKMFYKKKLEPFHSVLVQEVKRYNKLLKLVKNSLDNLSEILLGKQQVTEKAEYFFNYIQRFEVPPEWHIVMFKDLQWEYHVSTFDEAHIKEAPIEGIYVRGLFLEGAGWDKTNSMLIDPEPLHLITAMPVIHFKPVIESAMRGLYTCPCYYISQRVNEGGSTYLFSIDFKTKKSKEHWIKYGTAVIMSTND